ncbi:protein AATF [Hippocampus zosterae]|uniref:protein AATF n=1 Tax=Hippocampus zosterae TaxID=109293 RepID=UPI00223D8DC5|nr:protein AATF [Hippocampus zosterae]
MANSFSQELEDLLNPLPKFTDPEDDHDEATKARVVDTFAGDDDATADADDGVGALRRSNAIMLAESDRRYLGKAVSRQKLFLMDTEQDYDDDDEDDDEDDDDDDVCHDQDDQDEEDEEEEKEDGPDEELEEGDDVDEGSDPDLSFPAGVDLRKLTEGPGAIEGDEGETEDDEDEGAAISTFSKAKVDEEVEKGRAVRSQLAVWERLLEARIKMQKALASANRLPRPHVLPHFRARGDAQLAGATKNARKALKALQRSLLDLHDGLIQQSSAPVLVGLDEEDDDDDHKEGKAPKRKLDMADYPEMASKRFAAFRPFCDATLQKWHDKTRLSSGKSGGSGNFGAFERNIVTQVAQILMDRERLVRRTQTRRSEYRVLGTSEEQELACADAENRSEETRETDHSDRPAAPAGKPANDADEDVFDDDDFYHQLLRELIERKTGGADVNRQVAAGRQWLQIQKLRSKLKKKVDTKASKGRKVRFDVHAKLLNFMAPVLHDHDDLPHDARTELYRGLFGLRPPAVSSASAQ